MLELTSVDRPSWKSETVAIGEYFNQYGDRLPTALRQELQRVANNL